MRKTTCVVVALTATILRGQSPKTRPAFELADVHLSAKTLRPAFRSSMIRPGVRQWRTATMVDLLSMAYGIDAEYVTGGPDWLEMRRFDAIAKAPPDTSPENLRLMLQALLAERFNLVVHMDQKPMQAFVLSLMKDKPKLKQSDGSGLGACQREAAAAPGSVGISCRNLTMTAFVGQLRRLAGDYLPGPVVDQTKLIQSWDFKLTWTPRGALAAAGADRLDIFGAVADQLGLKLELQTVKTPVLVVDSVSPDPSPNPPGIAADLPSPPQPSFEVATVKPSAPQSQGMRIQTLSSGQINLQGLTLSYLIQTIWFVTPEMVVGAPKWFDTDRWDITAKVASEPGSPPQTDMDSMVTMVRALLEDRLKLKTHLEERIVPAYTLTASKPKLQRADPTSRAGCKEGPGADGRDPRISNPALSRLVTCRNVTMEQFAEMLPNIANALNPLNGYLKSPVADLTGLEGAYDFTLSFSPGGNPTEPPKARADGASDPAGTLTLEDAMIQQLGLKLERKRRPAQVLIIDSVEKPADN